MTKTTIREALFLFTFYLIACGAEGWADLLLR